MQKKNFESATGKECKLTSAASCACNARHHQPGNPGTHPRESRDIPGVHSLPPPSTRQALRAIRLDPPLPPPATRHANAMREARIAFAPPCHGHCACAQSPPAAPRPLRHANCCAQFPRRRSRLVTPPVSCAHTLRVSVSCAVSVSPFAPSCERETERPSHRESSREASLDTSLPPARATHGR